MLISKGKREWRSYVFPRHLNQGPHNYLALIKHIYDIRYVWDVNHPKKAPLKLTALQQYVFPRNLNHGTHLFAEINYSWPYWSLYHNLQKKNSTIELSKTAWYTLNSTFHKSKISSDTKYAVLSFPCTSLRSNFFVGCLSYN